MFADVVLVTGFVATENVAFEKPAGTVTESGTVTGSLLDSVTTTPPAGALSLRTTVPRDASPPFTDAGLTDTDASASAGRAVTVSGDDWRSDPLSDAVTIADPDATAVSTNVADDCPAPIVTDAGTVAAAVLLLARATVTPPVGAAAVSVTVPAVVPPAAIAETGNVTVEIAAVPEGVDGELLLQFTLAAPISSGTRTAMVLAHVPFVNESLLIS
jgi:hypothetical protein